MRRRAALRVALEAVGWVAAGAASAALAVAALSGHPEWVLVAVPAGAGLANWARRLARWRVLYTAARRRLALLEAIDRAPHRFGRRPGQSLYGPFVERVGEEVAIALLKRSPGPRRGRAARTKVVERRAFPGTDVGGAAEYLARLEDRAAECERGEREQADRARAAAERERQRRRAAAEEARLREIDAAHARDVARRESELREADAQARRREAELEAEALARALRRR